MTDDPSGPAGLAAQMMREALLRSLRREHVGDDEKTTKLQRIADALVDKAADGDMQAIKEVNDRIDGRALPGVAASEQRQTRRLVWLDYPSTLSFPSPRDSTSRDGSSSHSTNAENDSPAS